MSYSLDRYLDYLGKIEEINSQNKKSIEWMMDECAVEDHSERNQMKYLYSMITILKKFAPRKFLLDSASEEELRKIVININRSEYSESSKRAFKICIKKFYKLKGKGTAPKKVAFIKTTRKKEATVKKEDLYKPEELKRILSQMRNIRDRAFVMVQYETAARTGELLNSNLCDVRFDESGDFIRLHGLKDTPDRDIQLIEAGFYLKEWIESHPSGMDPFNVKNPSDPLWVKMEQFGCLTCGKSLMMHKRSKCSNYEPNLADRMTIANISSNFTKACKKAGVKKRTYRLYNLRHTRITEAAKFLSHEQLCKFAGWKPGSGQFHIYVHLTSEDVNEAIRRNYGIGREEETKPLTCRFCWKQSPPGTKECLTCRRPLRIEALQENSRVEQVKDALKVLAELQAEGKLEEILKLQGSLA